MVSINPSHWLLSYLSTITNVRILKCDLSYKCKNPNRHFFFVIKSLQEILKLSLNNVKIMFNFYLSFYVFYLVYKYNISYHIYSTFFFNHLKKAYVIISYSYLIAFEKYIYFWYLKYNTYKVHTTWYFFLCIKRLSKWLYNNIAR